MAPSTVASLAPVTEGRLPGSPASVRQASQAKASASISSPLIPASSVVETSVPGSSAARRAINQQTLHGHVASIGRAIVDQSVEQGTGLVANIKPNIPWVRLAQRVPVRIAFNELPADVTLVSGTTCTVSIGGQ